MMVRDNRVTSSTTVVVEFDEPDLNEARERATSDRLSARAPRTKPKREAEVKNPNGRLRDEARSVKPKLDVDTVRALTEAVAAEIHRRHGGNHVLDWLEAEILVHNVLDRPE